jgi:hypothetical protein
VLDEVLPPEERSALATSIRILRPPGTSRKERVQQLDQLAASASADHSSMQSPAASESSTCTRTEGR